MNSVFKFITDNQSLIETLLVLVAGGYGGHRLRQHHALRRATLAAEQAHPDDPEEQRKHTEALLLRPHRKVAAKLAARALRNALERRERKR